MSEYADSEVLVSVEWVGENVSGARIRVVEVDTDDTAYSEGHVPGAIVWERQRHLSDPACRDILSKESFEELMRSSGMTADSTVVLYGGDNNCFAAWAFWQLKIYGHADVRMLDGGRGRWISSGGTVETTAARPERSNYFVKDPDLSMRAFLPRVQQAVAASSAVIVDARSGAEYSGAGHIPGARSIPWSEACNEDGTFKTFDELKSLYAAGGIDGSRPVITYCSTGERGSHSWLVLKYLVGLRGVANYDGSWSEWGNMVGAPVERGMQ